MGLQRSSAWHHGPRRRRSSGGKATGKLRLLSKGNLARGLSAEWRPDSGNRKPAGWAWMARRAAAGRSGDTGKARADPHVGQPAGCGMRAWREAAGRSGDTGTARADFHAWQAGCGMRGVGVGSWAAG